MRFLIPALLIAVLILPGCMAGRITDDGIIEATVSLPASTARVREGEKVAKAYADALADQLASVADKVGAAEEAAAVRTAQAERNVKQMLLDALDQYGEGALQALLGILGIGGVAGGVVVARRKIAKAKAELPEDYDDVSEDYEEA